jgi:hypothetical protein
VFAQHIGAARCGIRRRGHTRARWTGATAASYRRCRTQPAIAPGIGHGGVSRRCRAAHRYGERTPAGDPRWCAGAGPRWMPSGRGRRVARVLPDHCGHQRAPVRCPTARRWRAAWQRPAPRREVRVRLRPAWRGRRRASFPAARWRPAPPRRGAVNRPAAWCTAGTRRGRRGNDRGTRAGRASSIARMTFLFFMDYFSVAGCMKPAPSRASLRNCGASASLSG